MVSGPCSTVFVHDVHAACGVRHCTTSVTYACAPESPHLDCILFASAVKVWRQGCTPSPRQASHQSEQASGRVQWPSIHVRTLLSSYKQYVLKLTSFRPCRSTGMCASTWSDTLVDTKHHRCATHAASYSRSGRDEPSDASRSACASAEMWRRCAATGACLSRVASCAWLLVCSMGNSLRALTGYRYCK